MAVAGLAWFPVILTSPVLLAVGANRDRALADLIGRAVSAVILCSAAFSGIMAMAASKLVTLPFQMVLSFCFVRRHVIFRWRELALALRKSAVVTALSALGPSSVVALSGSHFDLSLPATFVAALLAAAGWLVGALVTRHPVLLELRRVAEVLLETSFVRRLRSRISPHALGVGEGVVKEGRERGGGGGGGGGTTPGR